MQFIAAAAALTVLLSASDPSQDLTLPETKAHVEKARKALAKRKYKDALKEFRAAFQTEPKPTLLHNIGVCQEKLGDAPGALKSYRLYLSAIPDAPEKNQVTASIGKLEKKLKAKGV